MFDVATLQPCPGSKCDDTYERVKLLLLAQCHPCTSNGWTIHAMACRTPACLKHTYVLQGASLHVYDLQLNKMLMEERCLSEPEPSWTDNKTVCVIVTVLDHLT